MLLCGPEKIDPRRKWIEPEVQAAPKFFDPLEDTEDCFPVSHRNCSGPL